METRALVAAVAILGIQNFAPAGAVQDDESILARVNSVTSVPGDMGIVEKITPFVKDGSQKQRKVELYQKGSELRLAADQQYLYLLVFRKVRRIVSSVKNEDFMGTGFTYERGHSDLLNHLLARIERNFLNEQPESTMGGGSAAVQETGFRKSYDFNTFPEFSYQPVDNPKAVIGSFLVGRKEGTTYGAWEEVDQAYFGVKVRF